MAHVPATVLIVDDDSGITEMLQDILEVHGYRVLAANKRTQAFALLHEEPKPIDLLLVDVIMPDFSGRDFAASVHERWPECQVIFMTGYPVERLPAPGVPLGARVVSKPIVMQALLDTVGTAIGLPADRV